MTAWLVVAFVWLLAIASLLVFNHGAHR